MAKRLIPDAIAPPFQHLLFGLGGAGMASAFLFIFLFGERLLCAKVSLELPIILLAIFEGGVGGILFSLACSKIQQANEKAEVDWQRVTASLQIDETLRLVTHVFERASQGIIIANSQKKIITVNSAFTSITGLTRKDIWGKDFSIFLDQKRTPKIILDSLSTAVESGQDWQGEICAQRKKGEMFPALLQVIAVAEPQGQVENYIGFLSDITIRKQTDERLQHLAMHDILTGLPNRVLFIDQLQNAIWRAEQTGNKVAVLFLDLDGFKSINDKMGHHAGDEFLRVIAKRMQAAIKSTDSAARMGGDEFAVLLQNIGSPGDAVRATQRLLKSISQPIWIKNHELQITASVGISIYPEHSTEESLLATADQAMYLAKSQGKNGYFLYSANGEK
ncbi:MAG: hypothetical protein Fur0043_04380 [Anaerolineales bacterium]